MIYTTEAANLGRFYCKETSLGLVFQEKKTKTPPKNEKNE
jgi:hypothetical protein